MGATTIQIDPDWTDEPGIGDLIITDVRVLIRPAIPGQYPGRVKHDSARVFRILSLGNDMGMYTTHIISTQSVDATHRLLDKVFYAYVDVECQSLWCDAIVSYYLDGEYHHVAQYGFSDGSYTMHFRVYCNVVDAEVELARLQTDASSPYVVVRPDDSKLGYAVQGLTSLR